MAAKNNALNKPVNVSPALEAVVGKGPLTRAEVTSKVWAYIKANGHDKGFAEITRRDSKEFHDRDLYLAVHRMDGTAVAHGTNEKMVGKNFIEIKDMDGKEYIKERVSLAQSKGTFWTDYKFNNPVTKKIEPKTAYCERLDDYIVCGGIYKK